MEVRGLDLPKRESQQSIKADDGTVTDRRIATSRERFTAVFGAPPRARILLEASTESECVAAIWNRSVTRSSSPTRTRRRCTPIARAAPRPISARRAPCYGKPLHRAWGLDAGRRFTEGNSIGACLRSIEQTTRSPTARAPTGGRRRVR